MLKKDRVRYYVPIIELLEREYEGEMVSYVDREAERIKKKGCDVMLIKYCINKKVSFMLVRKKEDDEYFKLSNGFSTIKKQYGGIIDILARNSTAVLREY